MTQKAGWYKAPRNILSDTNLSSSDFRILMALIDHSSSIGEETFWIQGNRLAEKSAVSKRTVTISMKKLEELGYISREGHSKVNNKILYKLNEEKLYSTSEGRNTETQPVEVDESSKAIALEKKDSGAAAEHPAERTETALISTQSKKSIDCSSEEKEALKSPEIEEEINELVEEDTETTPNEFEEEENESAAPAIEYRSASKAAKEPLQSTISEPVINYIPSEEDKLKRADFEERKNIMTTREEKIALSGEMINWIYLNHCPGMPEEFLKKVDKQGSWIFGDQNYNWALKHKDDPEWMMYRQRN